MTPPEDLRRRIPQIAKLLERKAVKAAIDSRGRAVVDRAIKERIASLRLLAEAKDERAFEAALDSLDQGIA